MPNPSKPAHPLLLEVVRGNVAGWSSVNKFGINEDVDSATVPETIWTRGGLHVPPTAARVHAIVSTSTADDIDSGTGARTLRIYGNDSNFDEITEDVELQGQTPVNTTKSYTRIWRMQVLTAGSGQTNAGAITATAATDSTVTAEIVAGKSTTQMAVWTVPRDTTAYIRLGYASLRKQGGAASITADMALMVRSGINTSTPVLTEAQSFALAIDGTSGINYQYPIPKKVVGPADIEIRVIYISQNDGSIDAGFDAVYA